MTKIWVCQSYRLIKGWRMKHKDGNRPEREPPLPPIFTRCGECPYKAHGFICRGRDGSCMMTRIIKIYNKGGRGDENKHILAK
jgi:hypothetical protein